MAGEFLVLSRRLISRLLCFLLLAFASCEQPQLTPVPSPVPSSVAPGVSARLKQGMDAIMAAYLRDGISDALAVAESQGLEVQEATIPVYVYTTGQPGSAFTDELDSLGIETYNPSASSSFIFARVTLPQLQELAQKEFVRYITPPAETTVD